MSWHGHLQLHYRRASQGTVVFDRHSGPLRILRSLYPEGPAICHNVVVHPPAGIAGGDVLQLDATLDAGSHALLTTPGATRFYRSQGELAQQRVCIDAAENTRLEWLPQETICHPETLAENRLRFVLAPGAEMIGWDVLALGLPASGEPFTAGRVTQQIELPGVWLERGTVDGRDTLLLNSPLGWDGQRVLATLWFAAGSAIAPARQEALLTQAREAIGQCPLPALRERAGATATHAEVVVLRALAPAVEPAMALLIHVWQRWRRVAWGLDAPVPRVWRT